MHVRASARPRPVTSILIMTTTITMIVASVAIIVAAIIELLVVIIAIARAMQTQPSQQASKCTPTSKLTMSMHDAFEP